MVARQRLLSGPNNKMLHSPGGGFFFFFCPSSSPDELDSVSPMMKAQYTAALPQLDYFPGLPYIIQNPPLCVISCQFFEERSSQGGGRGNFLLQNFQFVSSHVMPGFGRTTNHFVSFLKRFTLSVCCPVVKVLFSIFFFFFLALTMSQRPYQTVASLSALPDNPATEHR